MNTLPPPLALQHAHSVMHERHRQAEQARRARDARSARRRSRRPVTSPDPRRALAHRAARLAVLWFAVAASSLGVLLVLVVQTAGIRNP